MPRPRSPARCGRRACRNSLGVISTSFLKDAGDAAWKNDPQIKAWSAFMDKYYPDGDKDDSYAVFGYAAADTLVQVLTPVRRRSLARQHHAAGGVAEELSEPDRAAGDRDQHRAEADFRPIKQMRLVQFDGNAWQPIGDVIESAFASGEREDN